MIKIKMGCGHRWGTGYYSNNYTREGQTRKCDVVTSACGWGQIKTGNDDNCINDITTSCPA
jgi:hypothetical protein